MRRVLVQSVAVGFAAASLWASPPAQEPSLPAVLARAAAYVADFHRQLSSIVAEEKYVQNWFQTARFAVQPPPGLAHRELKSDLLLLKPTGTDPWMAFRDVFEVDSDPVRDREERIAHLFLQRSPSGDALIRRILEERALQHRRHQAKRQHARISAAVPGGGESFPVQVQAHQRAHAAHRAREPLARRRVPRLDRSLGDRLPGERGGDD